jgi:hypothetical protein
LEKEEGEAGISKTLEQKINLENTDREENLALTQIKSKSNQLKNSPWEEITESSWADDMEKENQKIQENTPNEVDSHQEDLKETSEDDSSEESEEDLFVDYFSYVFEMTTEDISYILEEIHWNSDTPLCSDWKDYYVEGNYQNREKNWEKLLVDNRIKNYELSVMILFSFLSKNKMEALGFIESCTDYEWCDNVFRFFSKYVTDSFNKDDSVVDGLCIRSIPNFYSTESAMLWNFLTRTRFKTMDNFLQNSWAASLSLDDDLLDRQVKLEKYSWNFHSLYGPNMSFPMNHWVWRASTFKTLMLLDEVDFDFKGLRFTRDSLVDYFRAQGQLPPEHAADEDPQLEGGEGEEVEAQVQEDILRGLMYKNNTEPSNSNDFLNESLDAILSKSNL